MEEHFHIQMKELL
jgi:hypothetical protein